MFIETHLLQSFVPSNLNRDDTNNPKDCEFGGVRRARISSQCIKRSIREHPVFSQKTAVKNGTRTRWMSRMLVDALVEAGKDPETSQKIARQAAFYYSKLDKKKPDRTSVLIYLSSEEIQSLAGALLENWAEVSASQDKKTNEAIGKLVKPLHKATHGRTGAPDIALFGRMLAENPSLNIHAACQVAHAISTHRVSMDMDFFTAVDDFSREDETGAGMMGVTAFNSACFYRYARLDWQQLVANLDGDEALARQTVEGFLRAAVLAVPSGKQNSFAAQNPPSLALAVVRKDGMSWSLANAFEQPVRAGRGGGLVDPSVQQLDAYWQMLQTAYGSQDLHAAVLVVGAAAPLEALVENQVDSLDTWVAQTLSDLNGG